MAFCVHCGQEIDDHAQFCSYCGKQQSKASTSTSSSTSSGVYDDGNFGWSILGFCIPLVGLILYLVWKDEKPNNAHAAGMGALVGFVIGLIAGGLRFAILL